MLKGNDKFRQIFFSEVHKVAFYAPVSEAELHTSRVIAAGVQNIYSASGATRDYLEAIVDKGLEIVNEGNKKNIITDIAVLLNNIKYRLKYPIDEDCAIRMGAIYAIAEDEDPNVPNPIWMRKKMDWCKGNGADIKPDPDLYAFFLDMGVVLTPAWKDLQQNSERMNEYLEKRKEVLRTLGLSQ